MPRSYVKHLIECNCVLPQYKKKNPPIFHKFVVFSEFDEEGQIVPSFAQCAHCGAIHKVFEVFRSKTLPKETLGSLPSVKEIAMSLPENIVDLLNTYKCDLVSYQEVEWIFKNEAWGRQVILSKDETDGILTGKFLLILSPTFFKVDSFTEEMTDNE